MSVISTVLLPSTVLVFSWPTLQHFVLVSNEFCTGCIYAAYSSYGTLGLSFWERPDGKSKPKQDWNTANYGAMPSALSPFFRGTLHLFHTFFKSDELTVVTGLVNPRFTRVQVGSLALKHLKFPPHRSNGKTCGGFRCFTSIHITMASSVSPEVSHAPRASL